MQKSNSHKSAFSLIETVIAVVLVGGVMAMILGAVVILDRAVANERVVQFAPAESLTDWAYYDTDGKFPAFSRAPSRLADARADALWRAMRELYEQSYAVAVMNRYLVLDFSTPTNIFTGYLQKFVGGYGYLTADNNGDRFLPLTRDQLTDVWGLHTLLIDRFGPGKRPDNTDKMQTFDVWDPANANFPASIDLPTLRVATVFFLAPQDRILGILRVRCWQFKSDNDDPYRYYEVDLSRLRWEAQQPNAVDKNWRLLVAGNTANLVRDFYYRFVEDRRFPQNLIFPPTNTQLFDLSGDNNGQVPNTSSITADRNAIVRLATAGEDYALSSGTWDTNTNPGASRLQVSLVPNGGSGLSDFRAPVDEWHMVLPDPSLSQSEDRAGLRRAQSSFDATLDRTFRRQGKYGCALPVYP